MTYLGAQKSDSDSMALAPNNLMQKPRRLLSEYRLTIHSYLKNSLPNSKPLKTTMNKLLRRKTQSQIHLVLNILLS